MPSVTYNLEIERGMDFSFSITPVDENDAPLDLTGKTIRMHIRPLPNSDVVLVDASTENTLIVLDEKTSEIVFNLPASETEKLIYNKSVYDIIAYSESPSTKTRLLKGDVSVDTVITRLA